jgi:hypothetical protein
LRNFHVRPGIHPDTETMIYTHTYIYTMLRGEKSLQMILLSKYNIVV